MITHYIDRISKLLKSHTKTRFKFCRILDFKKSARSIFLELVPFLCQQWDLEVAILFPTSHRLVFSHPSADILIYKLKTKKTLKKKKKKKIELTSAAS